MEPDDEVKSPALFDDEKAPDLPPVLSSPPVPAPVNVSPPAAVEEAPVEDEVSVDPSARPAEFTDSDRIATVFPGDVGGWAALPVRLLGMGDSGEYVGSAVAIVKNLQEAAGLEPDGVIRGQTWALVLPSIRLGHSGHEVLILSRLLGLPDKTVVDGELQEAVENLQVLKSLPVTGRMSAETWAAAIGAA